MRNSRHSKLKRALKCFRKNRCTDVACRQLNSRTFENFHGTSPANGISNICKRLIKRRISTKEICVVYKQRGRGLRVYIKRVNHNFNWLTQTHFTLNIFSFIFYRSFTSVIDYSLTSIHCQLLMLNTFVLIFDVILNTPTSTFRGEQYLNTKTTTNTETNNVN